MTNDATLRGKRVLVAEDEYFTAKGLARDLKRAGAVVLGPVPSIREAVDLIASGPLDGAVLDLNLRGEMAFQVANDLAERGVPFVFATGCCADTMPTRYAGVTRHEKPVDPQRLVDLLSSD